MSPALLHRYLPDTKLIVVVRDPVERAYSHHRMYQRFYAAGYDAEGRVGDFDSDIAAELDAHRRGAPTRYLRPGFYIDLLEAWEEVYGTDRMSFTIGSDEFNGVTRDQNGVVRPVVFRHYHSFSQADRENGQSRIYLGIHWNFDNVDGLKVGRTLGEYVYRTTLQPRPRFVRVR